MITIPEFTHTRFSSSVFLVTMYYCPAALLSFKGFLNNRTDVVKYSELIVLV